MTRTSLTRTDRVGRPPLTHDHRCDVCGAEAFFRAVFVAGELAFCGHHGRELMGPLVQQALCVEDGTWLLTEWSRPRLDVD